MTNTHIIEHAIAEVGESPDDSMKTNAILSALTLVLIGLGGLSVAEATSQCKGYPGTVQPGVAVHSGTICTEAFVTVTKSGTSYRHAAWATGSSTHGPYQVSYVNNIAGSNSCSSPFGGSCTAGEQVRYDFANSCSSTNSRTQLLFPVALYTVTDSKAACASGSLIDPVAIAMKALSDGSNAASQTVIDIMSELP